MVFWQRLLQNLGLWPRGRKRISFHADTEVIDGLRLLAERERRSRGDVANDLLRGAVEKVQASETYLHRWHSLTEREQQVAALVCFNYTNPQIAARLGVSPETVKTHVRNLLEKFDLRSKMELRQALADWDFSAWAKRE